MTWAFDLYYKPPFDRMREATLSERISGLGGRFDYREEPVGAGICLTFEFDDSAKAEQVATLLRKQGEHVEGPYGYGD